MLQLQLVVLVCACLIVPSLTCTTLMVGKDASSDGSTFVSHSNDGGGTQDPRLVEVPAFDWSEGARRPIFFTPEDYPRYLTTLRLLPAYFPKATQKPRDPIGFIDQVPHTFRYFEGTYGIVNENGLAMGESTCSCVSWTDKGGQVSKPCTSPSDLNCARVSIDELSRIAMERATNASQACQLMGDLATKLGFYGADSFEGSAESLLVTDGTEAWVFHVLPHPKGNSAIWGAARMADNHVTVVANMFIIKEMNLSQPSLFLGTPGMSTIAQQYGIAQFCQSDESCDFTVTFSGGEYAHQYYSGRRMWRALALMAPDYDLSPHYGNLKDDAPYPFSVPVDPKGTGNKIDLARMFAVHRDYYQGTPFDMSVGLAGGPFGTPNRYAGGQGEQTVKGSWERPIAIFRTTHSFVVQTLKASVLGSVMWWGPHAAHCTAYTPFPVAAEIPDAFSRGIFEEVDKTSAFWAIRYVGSIMDLKWSYMIADVQNTQSYLESFSSLLVSTFQNGKNGTSVALAFGGNALQLVNVYTKLFDALMFKYADGYVNTPNLATPVGYPSWWLKQVGYMNGPPPPPSIVEITA